MELGGGYVWMAVLADGSTVKQLEQTEDGIKEVSVDVLKGQAVRELHMVPLNNQTHSLIIVDVNEDQEVLKYWVGTNVGNMPDGSPIKIPHIDAVGIIPKKGRSSRKPVLAFIYPDGSIRLTTDRNP